MGKVGPEFARNGEDQAGLNQLIERAEKIGECQARYGVSKWRHLGLHSVARKINPLQEVSDLVSANAQTNLEHFRMRHLLTHRGVQTRSTLLDGAEVKSGCVCDRLNVIVAGKVGVGFAIVVGIGS